MLDLESLRKRCADGETFEYVYFWGHQPSKSGKITKANITETGDRSAMVSPSHP